MIILFQISFNHCPNFKPYQELQNNEFKPDLGGFSYNAYLNIFRFFCFFLSFFFFFCFLVFFFFKTGLGN